jgi:hypothetical protein
MRDPIFDQVIAKQTRAVDTFQHAITQIDGDLRRIVSQRPELLDQAEEIQSLADHDLQRAQLAPAEQPAPVTIEDAQLPAAVQVDAITFDELVQRGLTQTPSLVIDGVPWQFEYQGQPITFENDNCYLVPDVNGPYPQRFERGDLLATLSSGALVVVKGAEPTPVVDETPHTPTEAEMQDLGRPPDVAADRDSLLPPITTQD